MLRFCFFYFTFVAVGQIRKTMIKNRFPKRKFQSIGDLHDFPPGKLVQHDLDLQNTETTETLQENNYKLKEPIIDLKGQNEELTKKLEAALEREGKEGDRNVNLEAQIAELNDQKKAFEKILLSQEQIIKSLNIQFKESEKDYLTLSSTLRYSETLNKEMTLDLNQFVAERTKCLEERDSLVTDINKHKNHMEMEKSNFDLIMRKKIDEMQSYAKEVNALRKEVDRLSTQLAQKENDAKELSNELEIKQDTISNQLRRVSLSDQTNKNILQELQEQQEKCKLLHGELHCLRATHRNSGIKDLSKDQSLEQLETTLHRKSAECRALLIRKDTLLNKIQSLEKENNILKEEKRKFCSALDQADKETRQREEVKEENKKLVTQVNVLQQKVDKLAENKRMSTERIKTLMDDVQHLTQQSQQHKQHCVTLQGENETLLEENGLWKLSFNETRKKLLTVEYEQSDEAKINLQKQNANLRVQLMCIKQNVSHLIEKHQLENASLKNENEKLKEWNEKVRQLCEGENKELKEELDILQTTLRNKEKLTSVKEYSQKNLVVENGTLQSRILTLEEQISNMKRITREIQNERFYVENENEGLQETIRKLNNVRNMERTRKV